MLLDPLGVTILTLSRLVVSFPRFAVFGAFEPDIVVCQLPPVVVGFCCPGMLGVRCIDPLSSLMSFGWPVCPLELCVALSWPCPYWFPKPSFNELFPIHLATPCTNPLGYLVLNFGPVPASFWDLAI